jgi:hypothetical protein
VKRIDVLPDDALLVIFGFYMDMHPSHFRENIEAWQSLVHVCRRWRSLVLGSPRSLNLRLFCTPETPAKGTLDIWPALPLIVEGDMSSTGETDNIIAALRQSYRICEVSLDLAGWQLEEVTATMQVSFPKLTVMELISIDETPQLVIPDSFLGGSAPRLRSFELSGISFPGLPKLLLSSTHLVDLVLFNIPESGYISPEAMVALLSVLSSLESLYLEFQPPQSLPDWESRSLSPPKRSILPALDEFYFKGDTEYLEDLVILLDAPRLHYMDINFLSQIDFDCPRLVQFIDCTPALGPRDEAHVQFDNSTASVKLRYRTSKFGFDHLLISIPCREPDLQLSSVAQVCNSCFPPPSTVEDLYIERGYRQLVWKNDAIENTLWLELLLTFSAVKDLYLSKEFAPDIAAALEELVGARIIEVLPSLQNIFVEGLRVKPSGRFQENIWQFAGARRQSDHPITISDWGEGPTWS